MVPSLVVAVVLLSLPSADGTTLAPSELLELGVAVLIVGVLDRVAPGDLLELVNALFSKESDRIASGERLGLGVALVNMGVVDGITSRELLELGDVVAE